MADFVNQMKSLRTIEKKVAKSKEKISLIGQLIQLLESMKQSLGNNDKDALKVWKGYQTHLLQSMGNLETAITKA